MNGMRVDFYEFVSHRDYAELYRAQAKLDPIRWRVNYYLGGSAKDAAGVRMNHCCGASLVLPKTMHPCRSTAAAPVWARDHFQIVAVGVGKIDPASAVIMIDLARAATPRVGPVLETLLADAAEDGIEISLGNQESVVLWLDRFIGGREIERHSVVEFDHLEGTEPDWRRQP